MQTFTTSELVLEPSNYTHHFQAVGTDVDATFLMGRVPSVLCSLFSEDKDKQRHHNRRGV